jgi:hypothetical protein
MGRKLSGTCLFLVAHLPRGPAAAQTNVASTRMQNAKSCKEFVNNIYSLLPDCVVGCWRRKDGRTHPQTLRSRFRSRHTQQEPTRKELVREGRKKERRKKEKGLRIDKVRNISSFLSFLELDCIRV